MELIFSLEQTPPTMPQEWEECNRASQRYGLSLSPLEMHALGEARVKALENTGRVEFGGGILKKLILAFCDSPYITQNSYAGILAQLQEIFYYFKNESLERLTDEELLELCGDFSTVRPMVAGDAAGSSLEELCRGLQRRRPEKKEGEQEDEDDEW